MLNRKGYSLGMWAATFIVIIAALAVIQKPFKNILATKVWQVTDYVFWTSIEEEPDLFYEDIPNTRSIKTSSQKQDAIRFEDHKGEITNYLDPKDNQRKGKAVGSSVGKGSEVLLKTFDLNNAFDFAEDN